VKNAGSKRIAERYVKALFDLASTAKALPAVEADLAALSAAIDASSELQAFIRNPLLSREQKAKTMQALLAKLNASALTIQFTVALASNQRLDVLPAIASMFSQWAQAARGEMSARVTSASPLGDKDRAAIAERLGKAYGKKINLQVQEDASLIGGVIVNIGSIQLDSSLSGKLNKLKQKLQAA
jgi:F-type H+-transporting ATPase subunit delta